jgi:peptidoglycan/LPS O-acetylase OafA/YrhL
VGVDVFFVISGFLITGQLVAELDRTGRISLPRFYARRAKRLLPAVAVVLATTVALVFLFVPKVRWQEIGGDIVSSALYLVNWRLADRSVDYLAEDSEASPVQHFWSLAVEEQYYLVWPMLILLAAVAARAAGRRSRPVLWIGLGLVAVPSFGWALVETARSPEQAFFVTTTRMWELAVGAAVALGAGWFVQLPKAWAAAAGWFGLAAIGLSGLLFTTSTPWPGSGALLPTLGTAAVIVAGFATFRGGPALLLGTVPLRWVGGLSYSLYLWHWPLIAVAAAYWGHLSAGLGLALVAVSFVPAWLTFRFVENPLRFSSRLSRSPRLTLGLGAGFTATGAVAGVALLAAFAAAVPDGKPARGPAPGAAVLAEDPRGDPAGAAVDQVDWITPDPLQATKDVPAIYSQGCQQGLEDSEPISCDYGSGEAGITVAVVGDSKIAQWLPAFQALADQNGWRLVTYTKSGCAFTLAEPQADGEPYPSCREWNEAVLGGLLADPPDYVLTSQRTGQAFNEEGDLSEQAMIDGMRRVWSALTAQGVKIVVIADTPHPGLRVYECVAENRDRLSACTFSRERYALSAAPTQRLAVEGQAGVAMVDMFDAICPVDPCAPVIGSVLIYRQGSHITATYIETLAPRLAVALSAAVLPARPETGP